MKRLLCLVLCFPLVAFAARNDRLPVDEDEQFIAAADAYRNGDAANLAKLREVLRSSELAPWLDYWSLRMHMDDAGNDADVRDFLDRNAGSYVAEKLRSDWLKHLGKQGEWKQFATAYSALLMPDDEVVCYGLRARLQAQSDATTLDEARPLWFSLPELVDACQPLFEVLRQSGRLTDDDVWTRLRGELEVNRLTQAKRTASFLPSRERPAAKLLDGIAARPRHYLDKLPANFASTRLGRELASFAVERLARLDTTTAATQFRRLEDKFPPAERAHLWGQIAWAAAWHHEAEATHWFELAGTTPLSDEQVAWKARAALREANWPALLQAIGQMPAAMAAQPEWTYWLGRALAAQNRLEEAQGFYRRIADQPGFYGNLAADELGLTISLPARAQPVTTEEYALASVNPGLRRALALMRLNMRIEGVREWNWTVRDMSDRQLLAAAELARRAEAFDRTISTAERTLVEHDYTLRYPTPFRDSVEAKAHELALDSSWVYGLMRQESRFIVGAKSAVGAKGVMQLMPTTARWVAKKIGLPGFRPARVNDLDVNLTLGTNYLRLILTSLDNQPVLASAAYNAGPAKARLWRADQPLEGAVYIATIPFSETRDYVKKVMSNSLYYAALFEGKPQSLKNRLGMIEARKPSDTLVESLP